MKIKKQDKKRRMIFFRVKFKRHKDFRKIYKVIRKLKECQPIIVMSINENYYPKKYLYDSW